MLEWLLHGCSVAHCSVGLAHTPGETGRGDQCRMQVKLHRAGPHLQIYNRQVHVSAQRTGRAVLLLPSQFFFLAPSESDRPWSCSLPPRAT